MGKFLSWLGSAAFLAVQLYELYQRVEGQRRAEREEAYFRELHARQEALALARHHTEEESREALESIALHTELIAYYLDRITRPDEAAGVSEPHQ
jgi:hypothetical protein